ncbi:M20 family metallopeptidase [Numidum massiliense]|uniref:M20 family metallopeptidase n=1 Tax=Numidum massiliense TaxID=1522315 RepID=UPI0006D57C5C|nr:M20 family metallopeptidase [Numidum massiliense]
MSVFTLAAQSYMPEFMRLLKESVNHDSPSTSKTHNDRMADWHTRHFLRIVGGEVRRQENATYGDQLCCEIGNGPKTVLLAGHYDTVWPVGEVSKRPFTISAGKAYGPGVYDMKASLLQALFALKLLHDTRSFPHDKKVVFFMNSDEEIGSPTSQQVIEREAKNAHAAFVLEPPQEPGGALKTARKGSGRFHLTIRGVAAHAGVNPENGVSAIEELAHQVRQLHALTDYETGTTVNVGIVKGGMSTNTIADRAEASIDVRVANKEEAANIRTSIYQMKPVLPAVELKVSGGIVRPPMPRTDETEALFMLARRIARQELGLNLQEAATGGVSDGNFIANCGVPTLDGLGIRGGGAHALTEHILIEDIPTRIALLARLIEQC